MPDNPELVYQYDSITLEATACPGAQGKESVLLEGGWEMEQRSNLTQSTAFCFFLNFHWASLGTASSWPASLPSLYPLTLPPSGTAGPQLFFLLDLCALLGPEQ